MHSDFKLISPKIICIYCKQQFSDIWARHRISYYNCALNGQPFPSIELRTAKNMHTVCFWFIIDWLPIFCWVISMVLRELSDLRHHRAHYDIIVMKTACKWMTWIYEITSNATTVRHKKIKFTTWEICISNAGLASSDTSRFISVS